MKLNCGAGRDTREGFVNLDRVALPGVDCVFDLERCATERLPFPDDSVEEFLLSHIIEHIQNVLPMMQELWRVAKPGALMSVRCPYGSTDDGWEDPQHVRPYFLGSFNYFAQPWYWRASYNYTGDWRLETVMLVLRPDANCVGRTPAEVLTKVNRDRNVVAEMIAELVAVKPPREPKRELQTVPKLRFAL